jgi:RNase P subunit RPR2
MSKQGRFYCKWCDRMRPIEELREEVDENEYVIWAGCKDCNRNWRQR